MKIINTFIPKTIKSFMVSAPLLLSTPILKAQTTEPSQDVFIKTHELDFDNIDGTNLFSPPIEVGDDIVYPAIVVDISEKRLYQYDNDTYLEEVYPVATGKKTTPTKPALKIITGIEKYPYKAAPKTTKRYKNPDDYGTYLLNLSIVDVKTGNIVENDGQYIHGTFKPESIGKNISKGCIRVNNKVINTLVEKLNVGQYVLIKE